MVSHSQPINPIVPEIGDYFQTTTNEPVSPRLIALKHHLHSGKYGVLDEFWAEVEGTGTPLIETIEGETEYVYTTFLWRGGAEIARVYLCGPFGISFVTGAYDLSQCAFTRLLESDVWFKTYRLRADARFGYRISAVGPNASKSDILNMRSWVVDPLNAKCFTIPKDDDNPDSYIAVFSGVELSQAPSQQLIVDQPNTAKGRIISQRFHSKTLENERRIWIYTPPHFTATEPHHFLLLFDGWRYVHEVPIGTVLNNLIGAGRLPPLIAVMLDSASPDSRLSELYYSTDFVEFLATELIPWVKEQFCISADPGHAIIGGSSAGGTAALFVAMQNPDLFGNVLCQDPATWRNPEKEQEPEWLARQFSKIERLPLRFYIEANLIIPPALPVFPGMLTANRHIRDVLIAKGYPVTYREYFGDHGMWIWRGSLGEGLSALIGHGR